MIYNADGKYMYEILEDYAEASNSIAQDEIFQSFCSAVWTNKNNRKLIKKTINFEVVKDLSDTDLGKIFKTWSEVEYLSYKSMTAYKDYASLIRQKVNNIYTNLFDDKVCLKKDYMNLIKTPKTLYYKWLAGEQLEIDYVKSAIDNAMDKAVDIKRQYSKQKLKMSWQEYKAECEKYFRRMFDNYINIDTYEDNMSINVHSGFWNEDNFCISYFCKSLDGYFRNYQKKYYGLYVPSSKNNKCIFKRCKQCGALIKAKGNKKMYCDACAKNIEKINAKNRKRKQRNLCHEIEKFENQLC